MSEFQKDGYMRNNDWLAGGELTVTVTLHEYRDLVSFKAKHEAELSNANMAKWKAERELKEAQQRISELVLGGGDGDEQ